MSGSRSTTSRAHLERDVLYKGSYYEDQPGTEELGPPTSSEEEPDTIDNDLFSPAYEIIRSQSGLSAVGVPLGDSKSNAMKAKYRLVQRWCALSLEPYVDEFGDRTSIGVQEAHVIPKAFGPRAITALEHAWGIGAGALKRVKDGPLNKIPLRADWHDCFDSSQFILLPRSEVLNRIQVEFDKYPKNLAKAGEAIPWNKPKIHHYIYIPIGDYCQTTPLFRRQFKANKPFEELETDSGKFFRPPDFDDFPVVESTVHPYAMIWKALYELRGKHVDELNINGSLKSLCFKAQSIVECWKLQMISAGHVVPWSEPINRGGDGDESDRSGNNSDNDSNIAPTSDGRASSQDQRSNSNVSDNSNAAPASKGALDRPSHEQPAEGETEVSYSNYQPSLDYSFSNSSSTPALDDEQSQEDDSRPRDLASYQPWSVDTWRSKGLHVVDDDDTQVHDDEHSLIYDSDAPPIYLEEKTAALPVGEYGHWEPDFMKRMDERRIRELALRLGYVDDDDAEMN